ncbi:MAG TPA: hypothetical protein DD440_00165 [Porticoccaceae bacterium]|nr:hypothetical protein [Porticoccaceae bacterium]|tara:strand:+ start:104 stop:619 length:516 start_codon:yes stop_codon:yes gene_type:complete
MEKPNPAMTTPSVIPKPIRPDGLTAQTAGLFRRLASLVYDAFLLFAIALAYAAILLSVRVIFLGLDGATRYDSGPVGQWLGFVGLYVSLSGYYYICWRKQGQTLGMKSWRLKLQSCDGRRANAQQCIKRCLLAPLSVVSLIGFIWCLLPPHRACWHDLATETHVIVIPKES